MTTLMRTKDGKWKVRDVRLSVDQTYETFEEASNKVHQCNLVKLRQMQGLEPQDDND